ncbi:unnamed protein product, partial [Rotaria socialis]
MLNYECEHREHLASLSRFEAGNGFSSSADSKVEIVATYDSDECELVQLSRYLRIGSGSEDDDNRIEREVDVATGEINRQLSSDNRIKQTNLTRFW